jgi:hypothetical protein
LAATLDPVGPTRELAQIAAVRSDDVCSNALRYLMICGVAA